jgi:hypothetical protein
MKHYVLIKPYGVYVKEGKFFESQGGLTEDWGLHWEKIDAESLDDARETAHIMACERYIEPIFDFAPFENERSGSVLQFGRIHKI